MLAAMKPPRRPGAWTGRYLPAAMVCLMLPAGCAFKGGCRGGGVQPGPAWQPEPVALRIYPSTRFVQQSGQAALEARIELFDQMGDSIKAAGRIRFELFATAAPGPGMRGLRLYTWNVEMLTLEDQQQYFDPITRGYLFRLKLDNLSITRRATLLHITFTQVGGLRLETQALVKTDW